MFFAGAVKTHVKLFFSNIDKLVRVSLSD